MSEKAYKDKLYILYDVIYRLYETAKTQRFKQLYKNQCWKIMAMTEFI